MTYVLAEHTFSTLRRLKNYLHSNMSQECLNNVIILHTHKNCTNKINLEEIAEEFVTFNGHRLHYFGHFFDQLLSCTSDYYLINTFITA